MGRPDQDLRAEVGGLIGRQALDLPSFCVGKFSTCIFARLLEHCLYTPHNELENEVARLPYEGGHGQRKCWL